MGIHFCYAENEVINALILYIKLMSDSYIIRAIMFVEREHCSRVSTNRNVNTAELSVEMLRKHE